MPKDKQAKQNELKQSVLLLFEFVKEVGNRDSSKVGHRTMLFNLMKKIRSFDFASLGNKGAGKVFGGQKFLKGTTFEKKGTKHHFVF